MLADARRRGQPAVRAAPWRALPARSLLATLAAIIASQATITGAFSVTRQAVQLDLLPRLRILQTSAHEHGQIFVPVVNALVFVAVCVFVVGFPAPRARSAAPTARRWPARWSITTVLGAMVLARDALEWPPGACALVFGPLLARRPGLPGRQPDQVRAGRLGAAAVRDGVVRRVHDLARRPPAAARGAAAPAPCRSGPAATARQGDARARHGRVPGERPALRADGAAAQPRAQPRRARAHRVPQHRDSCARRARIPTIACASEALLPERAISCTARFGFMETPDVSVGAQAVPRSRPAAVDARTAPSSSAGTWCARARAAVTRACGRLFAWMQRRSTQAVDFFRMPDGA